MKTTTPLIDLFCQCLNLEFFNCTFCDDGKFTLRKSLKKHIKIFHEVGSDYQVEDKIGSGSYGEIRIGKNLNSNEEVAIKLELMQPPKPKSPRLHLEYEFYQILGNHEGIPETYILDSFSDNKYNALVMELLGPSLSENFKFCDREFSLKTVLQIALQILDIVEYIHSKHLIHRDIKPDNFLIGHSFSNKENVIHVVDFGLSKKYIDPHTGKHIPFRECSTLVGTPTFMSTNAHMGKEQSRRDDLESLGYMIIYFLRGSLPWQWSTLNGKTIKEKLLKTGALKRATSISTLCEDCSVETKETMVSYFQIVRNLEFDEDPKYEELRMLFTDLMKRKNLENDGNFDWMESKEI